MKKAKFLLTAVTVLAIVGGALAFKVKDNNPFFSDTDRDGVCDDIILTTLTTTAVDQPGFQTSLYTAITPTEFCTTWVTTHQ